MTLQEIYLKQSVSDMFFNHEIVTKAYSDSLNFDNLETSHAHFVCQVSQELGVTLPEAAVIVDDFLARV